MSAGELPVCLRSARTPCLDEEYISHCGWSKPMWQVSQACGCWASFSEKVWRVWQASHDAAPKPLWPFATRRVCSGDFSPILWQPPQPFMPSVMRHGLPVDGGHGFHSRPCHGVLALLELCHLGFVALGAGFRGRDFGLRRIHCRAMVRAVTSIAGNVHLAVTTLFPVGNNIGGDLTVALNALLASYRISLRGASGRSGDRRIGKNEQEYSNCADCQLTH